MLKIFISNMQIISKGGHAILIHFIPVQSELSTFKEDEAAQPPTPPECLAFPTGRALPRQAKTTQSQRPRSPLQDLNRVGKWSNQKVWPALTAMDKRYRLGDAWTRWKVHSAPAFSN